VACETNREEVSEMPYTISQVTAVIMQVEDKVGVLARVLRVLREGGADMVGLASQRRRGTALMAIPEDLHAVRELAGRHGMALSERQVFVVEGEDGVSALSDIVQRIADAGINIEDVAAMSVGGKYQAVFTFADADLREAAQVMGLEWPDEFWTREESQ
jgi:hypothetical protein